MKMKGLIFICLAVLLVISTAGCQPAPTPTAAPTYTPYPTYTPFPTKTPIPTATQTATLRPSATPTITPTPRPYVPPTATSADTDGKKKGGGGTPLTWLNETSHIIKIVATGPATYTVTLQAFEEKEVQWVAGAYDILYYLDGASSPAGYDYLVVVAEQHYLLRLRL
jgi:hypothetical protein